VSGVRLERFYPHSRHKLWRALTEPDLIARWGMRVEGFSLEPGARFKFFGTPNRAWRGFIECEMLEAHEPALLRYSWIDKEGGKPTFVRWQLEARSGGTRLLFEHTGFRGVPGFLLSQLVMRPGHRKKHDLALPSLLAQMDELGNLRPT